MSRVSVVTPSFRQVPYLRRCAKSIADQSGEFEVEHLVQDGCGGPELETWIADQSFANVVVEEDGGMYDAINRGFLRAQGDILAWLNCDEQYLPGTLAKVTRWFDDHPGHDILFGDVVLVDPSSAPIAYRKAVLPIREHIRSCFLPTFSAATFVRRKVIDEGYLLNTDFRAISDAVWIDHLLGAGYRAGVLNEPLATFAFTGENLGQSERSFIESERWKRSCGANGRLRAAFWSAVHRVRKILAGAYRRRDVEISIYIGETGERETRRATVGGTWNPQPHQERIP